MNRQKKAAQEGRFTWRGRYIQLRGHVHSEEAYTWRKRTEYTKYITTKRTPHEGDGNIR